MRIVPNVHLFFRVRPDGDLLGRFLLKQPYQNEHLAIQPPLFAVVDDECDCGDMFVANQLVLRGNDLDKEGLIEQYATLSFCAACPQAFLAFYTVRYSHASGRREVERVERVSPTEEQLRRAQEAVARLAGTLAGAQVVQP